MQKGESQRQRKAFSSINIVCKCFCCCSDVGGGGGLDEQAGVAGLAVRARGDELLLDLALGGEELLEHPVGAVDEVLGEVVLDVDEAGLQRRHQAVDDGPLALQFFFDGPPPQLRV